MEQAPLEVQAESAGLGYEWLNRLSRTLGAALSANIDGNLSEDFSSTGVDQIPALKEGLCILPKGRPRKVAFQLRFGMTGRW